MILTIFMIVFAFIILMQSALPFLLKKTLVFGVLIPEAHTSDPTLISYKKRFSQFVLLTGLIALVVYVFLGLVNPLSEEQIVWAGLAGQIGILLLSMVLYLYFHVKTIKLKAAKKWDSEVKQIKIADLQSHAKDHMLPSFMFAIPMVVTTGLIVYTSSQYHLLPDMIPTHWGPSGQPDAFSHKTPFSAVALLLILFITQAMILGINLAIKKSGIKINPQQKKNSQMQQLAFRKYTSWFLLFISVFVTILISFFQLTTINPEFQNPSLMLALPLGFLFIVLIITGIYAFKVGQGGSRIDVLIEEESGSLGTNHDDADEKWKFGIFYVNKHDPSIFVEKRFGVGWSINFGNPLGYLLIFAPILLILGIVAFI